MISVTLMNGVIGNLPIQSSGQASSTSRQLWASGACPVTPSTCNRAAPISVVISPSSTVSSTLRKALAAINETSSSAGLARKLRRHFLGLFVGLHRFLSRHPLAGKVKDRESLNIRAPTSYPSLMTRLLELHKRSPHGNFGALS